MEITGLFPFDTDLVVQIIATRYSIDALNLTTVANWYAWYDNSKDMRCHRPRQAVSKASKYVRFHFFDFLPHVDSATDGSNAVEDGNESTPKDQLCVPDGKQDEHVTRPSTNMGIQVEVVAMDNCRLSRAEAGNSGRFIQLDLVGVLTL
ncbi:hypothetical protein Tco_0707554 [Tanacetum coccineum]|uniref:Uncharacterized protein n=1 Tax=Tanacetum coccineum TaxID=301880 RepID=A0ABQ4YAM1_9ASTR